MKKSEIIYPAHSSGGRNRKVKITEMSSLPLHQWEENWAENCTYCNSKDTSSLVWGQSQHKWLPGRSQAAPTTALSSCQRDTCLQRVPLSILTSWSHPQGSILFDHQITSLDSLHVKMPLKQINCALAFISRPFWHLSSQVHRYLLCLLKTGPCGKAILKRF